MNRQVAKKAACNYCGKRIEPINCRGNVRKYCCRKCKDMCWQKSHGWNNSKKDYEEWKSGQHIAIGSERNCDLCGAVFKKRSAHHKYCTKECYETSKYFAKRYGSYWRLAKNRFKLANELAAFKREVNDGP